MWRSAILKARVQQEKIDQSAAIEINFDGGGQPLTVGLGGLIRVTFPCRVLNCYIEAGGVTLTGCVPMIADATVYLGLGEQGLWAEGSTPLFGGTIPTLAGASESSLDVSDWAIDLQPGDLIPYGLLTFAGTATWLSVSLAVKRMDVPGIGVGTLVDGGAAEFTNATGDPFVVRG